MPATATFSPVFQAVTPKYSFTKSPAPIGAGGFVVNFDQSADGLRMVHGADVQSGGYIRNSGDALWASMFSPSTLLSAEYDPFPALVASDGFRGLAGVRIAPSNKNIIYSLWGSLLFKSTDGGATQRRTSMGSIAAWSNSGPPRYANPLIDIHPTDPLIVLVGSTHFAADTTKSGAFYTFDGGATAKTKISGLPSATDRGGVPDRYLVAFDPGDTTKAYVHVGGVGLYPITVGAGTMTAGSLIAGSPVRCNHLIVAAAGVVYCAAGGQNGGVITNDLYKRTRAGTATSFTTGCGNGAGSVAVDPSNANRIVCSDQDGALTVTYNGGTNWEFFAYYQNNLSVGTGEISWLSDKGFTAAGRIFPAMLKFDTVTANKLWITHGTGVSYCTVPTTTGGIIDLHDFSKGNEEKVGQAFLSVPGNRVTILGNWDYFLWPMVDLTGWTNTGLLPNPGQLGIGSDLDVARDDSSFYVCAVSQETAANAVSTDKGVTWGKLPNQGSHPYSTGAIAVSNKLNIITVGSDNGASFYTKDGGTTWSPLQLVAGVAIVNMINAQYISRKIVTADKARAGVFAIIVPGINSGGSARTDAGLYVSLDQGDTWTKKIAGIVGSSLSGFTGDTRQYYTEKLRYIPGFSGEMLHTCHSDLGPDFLHHLTNDGASIARLGSTVTDVTDFDFGPVMPGQTRPSVGFYGKVSGVEGLYISYDWFATAPTLVTRFPLDNLSVAPGNEALGLGVVVGMDKNRVRIFCGGIGWNYFS